MVDIGIEINSGVRTIIAIGGGQGSLRAGQKETLGRMTKSLGLAEGRAIIVHNEFLDALLFVRVEWSAELA